MYLVLSASTRRKDRNCWVGKPDEFPAPLLAQFNTGNCFLAVPAVSLWFWRTLCQAERCGLLCSVSAHCHTHTLERWMSTARQGGSLFLALSLGVGG